MMNQKISFALIYWIANVLVNFFDGIDMVLNTFW